MKVGHYFAIIICCLLFYSCQERGANITRDMSEVSGDTSITHQKPDSFKSEVIDSMVIQYNSDFESVEPDSDWTEPMKNDSIIAEQDTSLIGRIKYDIMKYADDQRALRMTKISKFYNSKYSEPDEYIPLLSYYYDCSCEEASEGIYTDIYNMFLKYPSKQRDFFELTMNIPEKDRHIILERFVDTLLSEIYLDNENLPNSRLEEIFRQKFPYLCSISEIDRILHQLANAKGYYNNSLYD